jgi:hypothetical protein
MTKESRKLQVGDFAVTDYNHTGHPTRVRIVHVSRGRSQSGILFRVSPALKNGKQDTWYDADWFEPIA